MTAPRITVVIPTRDRWPILALTLRALFAQGLPLQLLVADDGSRTPPPDSIRAGVAAFGPPSRLLRLPHRGPAAARNRLVPLAVAPRLLFLNDDCIPAPGLVSAHVGAPPETGAVGAVAWHPSLPVGRFMRFFWQRAYNFEGVAPGEPVGPSRIVTANLSVSADWARKVPFDESFVEGAFEDIEWGRRLLATGTNVLYRPEALAWHWHPTSIHRQLRRAARAGYANARMRTRSGSPRTDRARRTKIAGASLEMWFKAFWAAGEALLREAGIARDGRLERRFFRSLLRLYEMRGEAGFYREDVAP